MVTIVDYAKRTNAEGKEFFILRLQGGLELVKSSQTGQMYATAKTASITSTFTEEVCKSLIGQQLPGSVSRVECEPYEYTVQDTGEVITLSHRYEYRQEGDTMEEVVHQGKPELVEAL
ncbi:MAG: hypothetical protein RBR68_02015 [Tenuifilaceae bacterium]|nr:hypothetical protein [Tenuifilaceae bacterium]